MADIDIRVTGRAGRITLTRETALNALSHRMCLDITAALDAWAEDPAVALVLITAAGERAFCAGGDILDLYETAAKGDFDHGRRVWADACRMNARIANYPKPVVSLMQGITSGGGVSLGCHAAHRVVCETSTISLPQVAIGLVPDAGATALLARAPGYLGEYLGVTAARMGPGDAILAAFADTYVPREFWLDLETRLEETGDPSIVAQMAEAPPPGPIGVLRDAVDDIFAHPVAGIENALAATRTAFAKGAAQALDEVSPLAAACAHANIRAVRAEGDGLRDALAREYRFTWRAAEHGDLLEGIRARVIDKGAAPRWRHAALGDVTDAEVAFMLAPLGGDELRLDPAP